MHNFTWIAADGGEEGSWGRDGLCKGSSPEALESCPLMPGSVTAAYLCVRPEAPAGPSRNNSLFL